MKEVECPFCKIPNTCFTFAKEIGKNKKFYTKCCSCHFAGPIKDTREDAIKNFSSIFCIFNYKYVFLPAKCFFCGDIDSVFYYSENKIECNSCKISIKYKISLTDSTRLWNSLHRANDINHRIKIVDK